LTESVKLVSSTPKNYLPYLSKTNLTDAIAALPIDSRPAETPGWIQVLTRLRDKAQGIDVTTWAEGLEARESQHEVIAGSWNVFLTALLKNRPAPVVGSGHPLGLDTGQEALEPALTIPGQQAIPLEDRFASVKTATARDPKKIKQTLTKEFEKALGRRYESVGKPATEVTSEWLFDEGAFAPETKAQKVAALEARLKGWLALLRKTEAISEIAHRYTLVTLDELFVKVRAGLVSGAGEEVVEGAKTSWKTLREYDVEWQQERKEKQKEITDGIVSQEPVLRGEEYI
jgi:hypothetical protein